MTKAKFTSLILLAISTIGGILVTEGVMSGDSLTTIQNISGIIFLGGGTLSLTIVSILKAIPTKVVADVYKSATDKYGEVKINQILDNLVKVPELVDAFVVLANEINSVKTELLLNRDINAANGVYDNLPQDLQDRLDSIK